ncbi:MAG: iron-containing alcohol dehydrogenase [Chloroflexi bacterium]|nr:iron-containing alcohol dehydrogenase [Chloroflexota bacterium]
MRDSWGYSSAQEVVFGSGSVNKIGRIARKLNGTRAMVITDKAIVEAGLLEAVKGPLADSGLEVCVFDGGEPEPAIRVSDKCLAFAREAKPDTLVALGGGSNIDIAKAAAALLKYGGAPADYFGEGKVPGPVLPIIAVSTTSGTGSEVSPTAVLTDEEKNLKIGMSDNYLRPRVALFDPVLTLSMPPGVTAASGIDALCHSIEAFTAIDYRYLPATEDTVLYHGKNPLADVLAIEAIQLISENLRLAVLQGKNLEAREKMALANLTSGLSFTNAGVTAVHALAYPVGALTHAAHGVVNGLLLPYVMEFNIPTRPAEYAYIAELMGENIDGLSEFEAASLSVEAVRSLESDIGLPQRLSEIGVREEHLKGLAEATMGVTRLLRGNPRKVSVQDLEQILRNAL